MTDITTVGVDLAKSVFQIHGVDAETASGQLPSRQGGHFWAPIRGQYSLPIDTLADRIL